MTFAITVTHCPHYRYSNRLTIDLLEKKIETWNIANTTLSRAWEDAMRTARSMLEDGYAVTAISIKEAPES